MSRVLKGLLGMRHRRFSSLARTAIVAFTVILQGRKGEASAAPDPRTAPVLVKTVNVTSVSGRLCLESHSGSDVVGHARHERCLPPGGLCRVNRR
jgi:hypothetical protein